MGRDTRNILAGRSCPLLSQQVKACDKTSRRISSTRRLTPSIQMSAIQFELLTDCALVHKSPQSLFQLRVASSPAVSAHMLNKNECRALSNTLLLIRD